MHIVLCNLYSDQSETGLCISTVPAYLMNSYLTLSSVILYGEVTVQSVHKKCIRRRHLPIDFVVYHMWHQMWC